MSERVTSAARDQRPFIRQKVMTRNITIDATAVDAGNTGQTHILREGLILAYSTSVSAYVHYQAAGANGTDTARCILYEQVDLKNGDPAASATDHEATVLWIGEAVSDHCLLYDAAAKADLGVKAVNGGLIEFASA